MTDYTAIDALLADARRQAELPPTAQRRALREALDLSRTQVAKALGVSPSTVAGWETGRDPSGEIREKYAYFLNGAQEKLHTLTEGAPPHTPDGSASQRGTSQAGTPADDDTTLPVPQPCILCGAPATQHVEVLGVALDMVGGGGTAQDARLGDGKGGVVVGRGAGLRGAALRGGAVRGVR
uniref:helix-turn-helix domain-containing protein n=1 Tax=Streptomyces tricolor TaxID=68277 RepID=UPI00117FB3B9